MLTKRIVRLQLAAIAALAFGLILFAREADALTINPKCQKMRDKIGCTCALENGGWLYAGGTRWASARHTNRGRPTNQAFTDCNIRHRGA
jgi:hypothetical protein